METVELGPDDARELVAPYGEYDWWADRLVADTREALRHMLVAMGVREDGDPEPMCHLYRPPGDGTTFE